uniref:Selenoprotein H n=1 Tax=Anopheles funestus TaxID=62324 RepID=A0A182RR82_ANOFN
MAPRRKRSAAAKSTETAAKKSKPEENASKSSNEEQEGSKDAAEVHSELCELAPDHSFQLVLNENGKPRRGAFEVSIAKSMDDEKTLVWSGVSKGPPRKEKFPEVKSILDDVLKALK